MEDKEPFWVHCGKCHHEWAPAFLPMTAESFGKLVHNQCPACGSRKVIVGEFPKPTNEGDPIAWLSNGDTGISSKTIWSVMMRRSIGQRDWADVPHDPDDFGRCYRLLNVMPSWKTRLSEVATKYPDWAPLVERWDELTALFELESPSGRCPKLYRLMQELRDAAEHAKPTMR